MSAYPMFEPKRKYTQAFCTPEDIALAEGLRQFVEKEIMPRRQDLEGGWHRDEELALGTLNHLYKGLMELGVSQMGVPEAYGGRRSSPAARLIVSEELSRGDIGLATMVSKLFWATSIMMAARRDDLMEELAPRIVTGPWTTAVCITEPDGGCNIEDPAFGFRTIRTIARRDGTDYLLNGHKIWPGPGGQVDHFSGSDLKGHLGYWVVASTDPSLGPDGVGIFHVPPGAPGLSFSKPYQKMGLSWTDENVELWFDDVRIPARYRVDQEPAQGWKILKGQVVAFGRLASAASLVGLSEAVLETALDWTANRTIAGTPVRERSAFAMMLGEMFRDIDIARQYYLTVVWQAAQRGELRDLYGRAYEPEMVAKCSGARSFAGDVAERTTNQAMELMGAYGYAFDNHVEKYLRDYKMVRMWLGGPHRDRLDISQALYGPFAWPGDHVAYGGEGRPMEQVEQ